VRNGDKGMGQETGEMRVIRKKKVDSEGTRRKTDDRI
jgi:hypothetical protein